MPIQRRYGWENFQDLRNTDSNVKYNFPKFKFLIALTTTWLVYQLMGWNDKYKKVLDLVVLAACHFNKLIILLLDDMPQLSPTTEE